MTETWDWVRRPCRLLVAYARCGCICKRGCLRHDTRPRKQAPSGHMAKLVRPHEPDDRLRASEFRLTAVKHSTNSRLFMSTNSCPCLASRATHRRANGKTVLHPSLTAGMVRNSGQLGRQMREAIELLICYVNNMSIYVDIIIVPHPQPPPHWLSPSTKPWRPHTCRDITHYRPQSNLPGGFRP